MGQDCGESGARREPRGPAQVPAGVQHQSGQVGRRRRGAARCHGHQEQEQDASQAAQGGSHELEGTHT